MNKVTVIGAGLAGCEAAWQIAQAGISVCLYEMRPHVQTGAHSTHNLAELVCSNSLGSMDPTRASGLLKLELSIINSLLLDCAYHSAIPAGDALAVDRDQFSSLVFSSLNNHPNLEIKRQEVTEIPSSGITVLATGPLTSPKMMNSIQALTGTESCFFYDAIAPIINAESINTEVVFPATRYGRDSVASGDYLNCPFNKDEYLLFHQALINAKRVELKPFETEIDSGVRAGRSKYFESCLPIEVMASRGVDSLRYGPMRPTGLRDPRTGKRPYAVLQLRQDNALKSQYNVVGFQTNLTHPEQARVLRMVPGLQKAEFFRFGQLHRNSFIASPLLLEPDLQFKTRAGLFFAGQITGVEGYVESIATGALAGINAARLFQHHPTLMLPKTTMLGALCNYISTTSPEEFQPMKSNFGLLPPAEIITGTKYQKRAYLCERSISDLKQNFRSI